MTLLCGPSDRRPAEQQRLAHRFVGDGGRVIPRIGTRNVRAVTPVVVRFLLDAQREQWFPDIWCFQEVGVLSEEARQDLGALGSLVYAPRRTGSSRCSHSEHTLLYPNLLEVQVVRFSNKENTLQWCLANCYAPPGQTVHMNLFLDEFRQHPHDVDIFVGDFNAMHPSWSPAPAGKSRGSHDQARGLNIFAWVKASSWSLSNTSIPYSPTYCPPAGGLSSAIDFSSYIPVFDR